MAIISTKGKENEGVRGGGGEFIVYILLSRPQ